MSSRLRRPRTAAIAVASRALPGPVVVDIVGGNDVGAGLAGHFGQGVVAGRGEWLAVVPNLHGHVGPAKVALQACQLGPGGRRARTYEGFRDRSFATARQDEPVAVRAGRGSARTAGAAGAT